MSILGRGLRKQFPQRFYRGWWIVATTFFTQLVSSTASLWAFSVLLLPMEEDLKWSRSLLVGVLTLERIVGALLTSGMGPVVDRHGAQWLMTASVFIGGVCLVSLGFVTVSWQYYLAWAGIGLSGPGVMLLAPRVAIANWFVRKRALAFMIFTLGTPVSGIMLTPVVLWITTVSGWRMAWIVIGIAMLALVPMAWFSVKRRPEDVGLLPDGDPVGLGQNANSLEESALDVINVNDQDWTVREALQTRAFYLLTLAFALAMLPGSAVGVHMIPYVIGKGFSNMVAASVLSVFAAGALAGRPTWALLISRLLIYRALVAYGFLLGVVIFAFLASATITTLYVSCFLLGVMIGGTQQLQAQVFPDYYGRAICGTILGFSTIVVMGAGSVAPLFAALAYDSTESYTFVFTLFSTACLLSGVAFMGARPPIRKYRAFSGSLA